MNLSLNHLYWKRTRRLELDKYRTLSPGFNRSWLLFFGTAPPGVHPDVLTFLGATKARDMLAAAPGT